MATLGKSFLLLFSAEFLFYLSGYVVHMGAGRILGVEEYGKYSLIITVTLMIANLIGAGLPVAMGKFLSASHAKGNWPLASHIKKQVALWQSVFMMGVAGAFFLLAPVFGWALGDSTLVPFFQMASLIIPLYGADLYYFHYYSGLKRFDVQSWLKCTRAILRMSVIIALAYWFHLAGIIAGYIVVPAFVFLLAWWWDKKKVKKKESPREEKPVEFSLRQVFSLAGATTVFLVLFEMLVSFDTYVLKYVTGDNALIGAYSAALTVARIPTFLFYALTIILLPTISESRALKDAGRAKMLLRFTLRFMMFFTIPLMVLFFLYPEPIISILFGAQFQNATVLLPYLGVSMGLLTVLYVCGFAFLGANSSKKVLWIVAGGLFLNIACIFPVFEWFGILGVVWLKWAIAFFVLVSVLWGVYRVFGASISLYEGVASVVSGFLMYGVGSFFPVSVVSFFWGAPILFLLYGGVLFVFKVISKEDLKVIKHHA